MNESAPQRPKEKSEEALLSRRRLLGGAAAFAGSALLGSYLLTKDNGADEDRINELDPPSPSPEKLSELTLVRNNIRTRVESIRKRSFMEKPNRGKNMLNNSVLNPDYASVAIVVEENGVLRLLHLQNVRQLSKQTRNGAGSGVYTHLEGGTKYQIALEDTVVDIGVSNRFSVRKQSEGENSTLPVHAVKRSRYEKEHVANKVIDKNGKEKVVKEVLGDYVGYVTYIPPASHLTHKESISSGKEYVDTVLESAYTVLSHRMTKSNQKVLGLCRDICRRLAVIEHVDPNVIIRAEAKKSGETETHTEARKRSIYQKMYAEYGLNQDTSFNHLINFLGAGGMMQIMQKTYRDVRLRMIARKLFLPEEISEDANEGRKDPLISAIIAMYLCYDNYLVKGKILSGKRDDEIELALVAMYNGSPNLLTKILKRVGKNKIVSNARVEKTLASYPNPTPFVEKLLTHREGIQIPGSSESENGNYLGKYVWLKSNEKRM